MSLTQLQHLAAAHAGAGHADLAKTFQDMAQLYERKLYHQLTAKSLELVKHPYYTSGEGGDELLKVRFSPFFFSGAGFPSGQVSSLTPSV